MQDSKYQYKYIDSEWNFICSPVYHTQNYECRCKKAVDDTRKLKSITANTTMYNIPLNASIIGIEVISFFALAASATKKQPAENRHHIVPRELIPASHAVGPFGHHCLMLRYAVDTDI